MLTSSRDIKQRLTFQRRFPNEARPPETARMPPPFVN
jgi:hypothetical protein